MGESDALDKPTLRVGQLNIYWGDTLAEAVRILRARPPLDLLCLQEAYDHDLGVIGAHLGLSYPYFAKMGLHTPTEKDFRGGNTGIAILSRQPLEAVVQSDTGVVYDDPEWEWWKEFNNTQMHTRLLHGHCLFGERRLTIATTHGAWAPSASTEPSTPLQREQLKTIRSLLGNPAEELTFTILAADFNQRCAPDVLEELQPGFQSALPPGTTTTIDPSHRALQAGKQFEVPVDDIYYTRDLHCVETTILTGLSDHMYVESVFGLVS